MSEIGALGLSGENGMDSTYLIRYGLWPQVGRFISGLPDLKRGQRVVVRSHRGTELGEVLIKVHSDSTLEDAPPSSPPDRAPILRLAAPDDLERARQLEQDRPRRFELCRQVIQAHGALELIDVEPLLDDDQRTVLHYLGPHHLEATELVATLRSRCDIDIVLEPVGRDVPDDAPADDPGQGCGHCSSGAGCGSGGGCSSRTASPHSGCSDCGIKRLVASRRPLVTH